MGIEIANTPSKGKEAWVGRVRCDQCGRQSARRSTICAWNGNAPVIDTRYGIRASDPVLLCGFACQDRMLEENPEFRLRSMSFPQFVSQLAADILPSTGNDPTHECKLRIELYLSARPNEFVPLKSLHAAIPHSVRQSGAWSTALTQMLSEGRLQARRTKSNPKAARGRTEYRLVVPGEPARN